MRSPEHGYALALNYQRSLGDTLTGSLRVDFSYQDEMSFDADNSTVGGADSYQAWNARIGLAHGGGWELALWASNLGDEDYVVHAFDIAGGGFAVHGNPRMWGITAGYEI